ncbi:hypothetical protein, partial [Xanthomonas campestris]|uniref:hypothetical protein n=1 Tax=Xanthomonas campestris TaxID=339 RepID=UPI00355639A7
KQAQDDQRTKTNEHRNGDRVKLQHGSSCQHRTAGTNAREPHCDVLLSLQPFRGDHLQRIDCSQLNLHPGKAFVDLLLRRFIFVAGDPEEKAATRNISEIRSKAYPSTCFTCFSYNNSQSANQAFQGTIII